MAIERTDKLTTDRTSAPPARRLAPPAPARVADLEAPPASISIVIPAYNEAHHVGDSLAEVMRYARSDPRVLEVIVVDDGSTDDTARIVTSNVEMYRAAKTRLRLLRHERNLGKGAAVRTGVLQATADLVVFTDADLSSPIETLPALVEPIVNRQCDIVIASRALDRSLIDVRQTWFRETAGKFFNAIVRLTTGLPIKDTQCGFKAFRREAILPVFRRQRIDDFAFDVEILYLARKHGLTIHELPLPWSHVDHTKVSMFSDSARMFRDVLRIRLNHARGAYRAENGERVPIRMADPATTRTDERITQ